ncbi:MAG: SpoIIE family protein phosphatase [Candidatus Pelagadaptatus aseana]|uniref:response regulator n=1 Tax=Candidatus Pelagadaptatus aseana TaxID=3120508 RepID=UPI0039B1509C
MSAANRTLLVVDDDTIVRQSVVAYLEDSGFDILEAEQGRQGLEMFNSHSPDLVLTDLKMPEMNGLDLLAEIHRESNEVPVIVISGVGVMGDVVEALRLGAADYMIKPLVDMEVLVHAVNKSLERRDLLAENELYRVELEETNLQLREHLLTLQKDQQAGRQVQQQLLPESPFIKDQYVIEHQIIPSLFLSGDFVDVSTIGDRYLAFYLTDVSGHGASSAFATVWLKYVAQELEGEHLSFLGAEGDLDNQFLEQVNQALIDSDLDHHMTCFCGVIDTLKNKMYYSIAGHLPLPVMLIDGFPRYLQGSGRPLGIFPGQSWEYYEIDFPRGASLVGFSDGILEIMPAKDLLEKEGLLLQYLINCDGSLSSVCGALMLDRLENSPDDIAVLSISRALD